MRVEISLTSELERSLSSARANRWPRFREFSFQLIYRIGSPAPLQSGGRKYRLS